jgi:YbbR domain-containing protein
MLKNNTVLKILSLLIAIVLWMYVIGEVNPTTRKTIEKVPVEILNQDTLAQRDLAIEDTANFTVDVVVSGKKVDLDQLRKDKIKATANVFGYEEGENEVPVQVEPPEGITIVEVKTPKLKINLEQLVSVYKPISFSFTGGREAGTELGGVSTSPKEIEIKGGKSAVNSVSSVRAQLDIAKVTEEAQIFNVTAVPINEAGDPVYNVELSAKTVEVEAALYHTKTVPLRVKTIGQVPVQYQVTSMDIPKSITIRGPESQLAKVKQIDAGTVDISKVKASATLPIKPDLPEQIEIADKSKNIGVKIAIKGLSTKTITLSTKDAEIENLDKALNAYINTAEVKAVIIGDAELLSETSAKDFQLIVDLQGVKEGTASILIKVNTDKKFSSIKLLPKKVDVTVNKLAK